MKANLEISNMLISDKSHVLVLDDQKANLQALVELLSDAYYVHPFVDADAFLRYVESGKPADVILLDIVMPGKDGYEVCKLLRNIPQAEDIPIIFLTGLDNKGDEEKGLQLGAADYITKPFSSEIVLSRVRNQANLSRALRIIQEQNKFLDQRIAERTADLAKKNAELLRTQSATVNALCNLSELRDNETGKHIIRTATFVKELALALRSKHSRYAAVLTDDVIDDLFRSAPLHDIGKVAIPDNILLKPGKLTPEEFEIMKTHASHGGHALEQAEKSLGTSNSFLRTAIEIANCHHEKWNGSGYPKGLSGEDIPLSARIMAIADVYDALTCKRVYKPSMLHEKATALMVEGRSAHFDPTLIDTYLEIQHKFMEIAHELADE